MKRSHLIVPFRRIVPVLVLVGSIAVASILMLSDAGHAVAGYMRYDGGSDYQGFTCASYNMSTGTYDWGGGNTCTFPCDAAHDGQSCSVTSTVGSGTYPGCTGFTTCAYSICHTDNYTCVSPSCSPSSACAANTCSDSTCSDACGNSYQGTKNCAPACVGNVGASCSSGSNSCGQTNTGTISCAGACSASTPSDSSCPVVTCQSQGYDTGTYPNCRMYTCQDYGYQHGTVGNCYNDPVCVSYQGQSCSASNSCGMVGYGTYQCNGSCSAVAPSNSSCPATPTCADSGQLGTYPNCYSPCVSYQGQSCSESNSCGNMTNYGSYQCDGSCSVGAPSESYCPAPPSPSVSCTASATSVTVGASVTYNANPANGATGSYVWTAGDGGSYGSASTASRTFSTAGTYAMNVRGSNTSTSYCPNVTVTSAAGGWCTSATPALSITAASTRVKAGQSTTISWSASGVNGQNASCTVTGPGVAWTSAVSASPSCSVPSSSSSATITGQSIYTLTCGSQSKSVTVNVIPNFTEF